MQLTGSLKYLRNQSHSPVSQKKKEMNRQDSYSSISDQENNKDTQNLEKHKM